MNAKTILLNNINKLGLLICLLGMGLFTQAQTTVTASNNGTTLVNALLGPGINATNIQLTSSGSASGTFAGANFGIGNGVLLTSGSVNNAPGPNNAPNTSTNNNAGAHPLIAGSLDATSLTFDFIPGGTNISFNYIFASEEYPEFVCAGVNDAFGFFLSGPNPAGGTYNNVNLATLPNGAPVSVDDVSPIQNDGTFCTGVNNSAFYVDNAAGGSNTEYDGHTVSLTAQAPVNACATYTITLVIADRGDRIFDSGVFLQQGSFMSNNPAPEYFYTDADGNPQDVFCNGEDVFIDATGSVQGTDWFLAIWQYDIGGWAAGDPHLNWCGNGGWTSGDVGIENISDIWENCFGSNFWNGYEYYVQLALSDGCGGWFPAEGSTFTVSRDPIPDYFYTDAAGNPKSTFCLGEDVFLNGEGSMHEERYFLSIWQYELGGWAAGDDNTGYSRLDPEWAQGEVGSSIHLNPIWANFESDFFEPGFEYVVQLAVGNDCDGWVAKMDLLFTVECCDEPETCFGYFELDAFELSNGFVFHRTDDVASHDNPWSENSWFLFEHDNFGSGPYDPIDSGTGDDFVFIGEFGKCYTLVHKVTTPCGTCCYFREICHNGGGSEAQGGEGDIESRPSVGESQTSAPDIPCDSLEIEFCHAVGAPTNLNCSPRPEGGTRLSWTPVPFAIDYIVTIIINDPDCCELGDDRPDVEGQGTDNRVEQRSETAQAFIDITLPVGTCFSWQVIAVCPDEVKSPPSEKICEETPCSNIHDEEEEDPRVDIGRSSGASKDEASIAGNQIKVFPNPATNIVNFTLTTAKVSNDASINIYDINHRLVDKVSNFMIQGNTISGKWQPSNQVGAGLFFIEVVLDHTVLSEKILIVK